MKILILSDYIEGYQDIASFRIRYLTALKISQAGHKVLFMSPASNQTVFATNRIVNGNFRAITTPGILPIGFRSGGFSLTDCLYKVAVCLRHRFDVIHVTNGHRPAQFAPSFVGKFLRNASIVDECWEWIGKGGFSETRRGLLGKIISRYDAWSELRLKRIFDHIIAITSTLKNRFEKGNSITVLHGGAEIDILKNYTIEEARRSLNLEPDHFIVGMSNVIQSDHEDNRLFFSGFSRLCEENENIYLIATGPDKQYIDDIGNKYSLSDRIIHPGWVNLDTYNKYLSACNIFVLPYRKTNINMGRWPNKIGDYLCLDRPIITNPTGDVEELFQKYKIGLLCDETPDGFNSVIKKIIKKKLATGQYTEDQSFVANEILSFDKRVSHILDIYENLAELKIRSLKELS